ncbi:unnamed protein product [Closterium sp. Yama58-4]|nr:unnamed protein product [Closterium sp. Yama58-4]
MESAEEAVVDLFRLAPATLAERAVAIRLIFCDSFQRLLAILRHRLVNRVAKLQKFLAMLVRRAWTSLNPRNPGFVLGTVVLGALIVRRYRLRSFKAEMAVRRKFWANLMATALTYDEWAHAAAMLEKYQPRRRDSDLYDEDLLRAKLVDLRRRRLEGGVEGIVFAMRSDLLRNLGNMCNPQLHQGRLQMPRLIEEYIDEVRFHLRAVCDSHADAFPRDAKLAFIHETRHAFGRTALLLSGGAALGAFHLGVVRTLIEHRMLPRVLAGASVGSIICSFVATRTGSELQAFFEENMQSLTFFESMGSVFATAQRLLVRGAIGEIGVLQRRLRQLIGDLTFQEAYDLSGRVLGIPVCSMRPQEPHRLLTYLSAPHVVIWSAVTASCAFPGLFEAQELMAKDSSGRIVPFHMPSEAGPEEPAAAVKQRAWRDGSLESDLPMQELREQFNVNHFIVSQANPHIAPLLRLKNACRVYGGEWAAKLAQLAEMELKHRCEQALAMGWRVGGLAKLFAQPWEGDITIVMHATLAQFAKIIQNPTPSELRAAIQQGRRGTWERLSAIRAHCGIELMLDECVSILHRRRTPPPSTAAAAARAPTLGPALSPAARTLSHPSLPLMAAVHAAGAGEERARAGAQAGAGAGVAGGAAGTVTGLPVGAGGTSIGAVGAGVGAGGVWGSGGAGRGSFRKRIPSWNQFARESSWGSLDEDGAAASLPAAATAGAAGLAGGGGSGAGAAAGGGESSDSDGERERERENAMLAWMRAGGPLLRTASSGRVVGLEERTEGSGAGEVGQGRAELAGSEEMAAGRVAHGELTHPHLVTEAHGAATITTTTAAAAAAAAASLPVSATGLYLPFPPSNAPPALSPVSPPFQGHGFLSHLRSHFYPSPTSAAPTTHFLFAPTTAAAAPGHFHAPSFSTPPGPADAGFLVSRGSGGEEEAEEERVVGLVLESSMHCAPSTAVRAATMRSVLEGGAVHAGGGSGLGLGLEMGVGVSMGQGMAGHMFRAGSAGAVGVSDVVMQPAASSAAPPHAHARVPHHQQQQQQQQEQQQHGMECGSQEARVSLAEGMAGAPAASAGAAAGSAGAAAGSAGAENRQGVEEAQGASRGAPHGSSAASTDTLALTPPTAPASLSLSAAPLSAPSSHPSSPSSSSPSAAASSPVSISPSFSDWRHLSQFVIPTTTVNEMACIVAERVCVDVDALFSSCWEQNDSLARFVCGLVSLPRLVDFQWNRSSNHVAAKAAPPVVETPTVNLEAAAVVVGVSDVDDEAPASDMSVEASNVTLETPSVNEATDGSEEAEAFWLGVEPEEVAPSFQVAEAQQGVKVGAEESSGCSVAAAARTSWA